jgi:hypothetical protein
MLFKLVEKFWDKLPISKATLLHMDVKFADCTFFEASNATAKLLLLSYIFLLNESCWKLKLLGNVFGGDSAIVHVDDFVLCLRVMISPADVCGGHAGKRTEEELVLLMAGVDGLC